MVFGCKIQLHPEDFKSFNIHEEGIGINKSKSSIEASHVKTNKPLLDIEKDVLELRFLMKLKINSG